MPAFCRHWPSRTSIPCGRGPPPAARLRPRRHGGLEDLHGLVVERPEARREGAAPAPAATSPAAGPAVAFGHSYNKSNQRIGETVSDTAWLSYPSGAGTTAYTAVGAVTPTYDGNGNLTFDGAITLGHDPENRLVSASGGGNAATYAFDPRGRRKVRTVNGTTTITVTGADNRELLDYDGATGQIVRWYAYGPGSNAALNQMNIAPGGGPDTRDTLLPNLLGSIVASVDSGTGTIAPFGYRPYGTTTAAPVQFGYTGQRIDQETGLYYYRARHYSPAWGRFAQADPIGYQGGINLYAYVGNDPLNLIDPEGLLSWMGVARFVGGSLEAATGIGLGLATGWSGVGAIAGGAIALHGIDVAQAAWRGTDTFTSQGLQSAGVPQSAANAIDTGISGAVAIAAGRPVLPYSQFGSAISGGGQGVSVISATARGFVVPSIQIPGRVTESSGVVANALRSYYGTASVAGLTGRVASDASVVYGAGLLGYSAYQIGVFGSAQAAETPPVGWSSDPLPFFMK
ncbi:MAG: hypothetical protein K2Y40_03810 [Reyranella sp.]|nr:hypothetical protein [Reyranella sp.]